MVISNEIRNFERNDRGRKEHYFAGLKLQVLGSLREAVAEEGRRQSRDRKELDV